MYRWVADLIPTALNDIFTANNNIHNYFTRNAGGPHLYANKSSLWLKSFLYELAKLWLRLPSEIKSSNNLKLYGKRF